MEEKLVSAVSMYLELNNMSNKNYHNRERKAYLCVSGLFMSCTHILCESRLFSIAVIAGPPSLSRSSSKQSMREWILHLMLIVKKKISNSKQTVRATELCWSYGRPGQDLVVMVKRRTCSIFFSAHKDLIPALPSAPSVLFCPKKWPRGHGPLWRRK